MFCLGDDITHHIYDFHHCQEMIQNALKLNTLESVMIISTILVEGLWELTKSTVSPVLKFKLMLT